jgi:hypothetical protein
LQIGFLNFRNQVFGVSGKFRNGHAVVLAIDLAIDILGGELQE